MLTMKEEEGAMRVVLARTSAPMLKGLVTRRDTRIVIIKITKYPENMTLQEVAPLELTTLRLLMNYDGTLLTVGHGRAPCYLTHWPTGSCTQ